MSALRSVIAVLALVLIGGQVFAQTGLRYRPVNLVETDPNEIRIGALVFMGGLQLVSDDKDFGGLSGIVVTPDGRRIHGVADNGHWWTALLGYDRYGRLDSIAGSIIEPFLAPDGKPVQGKANGDAEALTVAPDGAMVVAFERRHRLWRYGPGQAFRVMRPQLLPSPPGLEAAPVNRGIEAMTYLDDGRLFLVAEDLRDANGDFQAWLMRGLEAEILGIVPTGDYKPSDAARLPSGDLLLLERRFARIGGFTARLSRIYKEDIAAGARLATRPVAVFERPYVSENFEGVAVAPDPTAPGHVRIYLVSDDNFHPMQRTLLLMFRMREDAGR